MDKYHDILNNKSKTKTGGPHQTIISHSTNASHSLRQKNDGSRRMNSLDIAESNHGYDFSRVSLPFNFASAQQDGRTNSSTHSLPQEHEEEQAPINEPGKRNIRSFVAEDQPRTSLRS